MTASNVAAKIIPQPQAKRLRAAALPTIVGRGVQLVGVDGPTPTSAPSAKTVGVVEFPAPTSVVPTLAEVIAEAVVERLQAMGATVNVTGAQLTSPTLSASSARAPVLSAATALDDPPPILLSTMMAARLLGCSVKALYHRVAERQIPSSCIVRSGRRILFHRAKLLEAMERRAGR